MIDSTPFAYPSHGNVDRLATATAALRRVEQAVMETLRDAGYEEVLPPVVDVLEVFAETGAGVVKLVDRSGHVMGLRADFTGPVARIAGMQLRDLTGPLRLSYHGTTFRDQGGLRQRMEAGGELYGAAGPAADAEVLRTALACVRSVGIEGRLAIGSMALVESLLPTTPALRRALDRRDRKTLRSLPEVQALSPESQRAAEALLDLVGGPEILSQARELLPGCAAALDELEALAQNLEGEDFELDLAHVRLPAYYTGTVFDVYVEGAARAIGGGGRYDSLAARYGPARPAAGFAVDLDALAGFSRAC